mgnify:CR=1 FL=1
MTVEEEIELQTVPPLCRLPQASRERLLASAIQHRVAAGTVLFEQGELPTFQIVVLAGGQFASPRELGARFLEIIEANREAGACA